MGLRRLHLIHASPYGAPNRKEGEGKRERMKNPFTSPAVYRRKRIPQHVPAYVSWAGPQSALLPQRSSANRNRMVMPDLHWAWLILRGWGRSLASLSLFWPNQIGFCWLWREETLLSGRWPAVSVSGAYPWVFSRTIIEEIPIFLYAITDTFPEHSWRMDSLCPHLGSLQKLTSDIHSSAESLFRRYKKHRQGHGNWQKDGKAGNKEWIRKLVIKVSNWSLTL